MPYKHPTKNWMRNSRKIISHWIRKDNTNQAVDTVSPSRIP